MVLLEPSDFEPPRLARLAAQTNLSPAAFAERFSRVGLD
jgi:AraC-like DNA-binding protein